MGFEYNLKDLHFPEERKKKKNTKSEYTLPGEKKKGETSIWREVLDYVFIVLAAMFIGYLIDHVLITNAFVPTGSMESTIHAGDRIIGNRLAYIRSEPQRGDIIIFPFPDNEKETYVKRIIGMPGETVLITDGKVYIDGSETPLEEPYLKEPMNGSFGPYTVPENCYFVMGDNRNDSWDGRYWDNKFVSRNKIESKAVFALFPQPRILH